MSDDTAAGVSDRSPLPDAGVAAAGYVCQNFPEHPGEEPEMVSAGAGEGGVICPECGRMAAGPDDEIPYGDPPYDDGLSDTDSALTADPDGGDDA